MKHKKKIENSIEQIQHKGFMIKREGCKYRIQGQAMLYSSIGLAKSFIDMIDESNKKFIKPDTFLPKPLL